MWAQQCRPIDNHIGLPVYGFYIKGVILANIFWNRFFLTCMAERLKYSPANTKVAESNLGYGLLFLVMTAIISLSERTFMYMFVDTNKLLLLPSSLRLTYIIQGMGRLFNAKVS